MAKAKSFIPQGLHSVTPHLMLSNAASAIDWYMRAFGAVEVGGRAVGPDGKIMHAELQIGDSRLMLNDAMGGSKSAKGFGGSPISLWIYVPDCDTLFNRAVKAGAQVGPGPMGQLADQFWGDRTGMLKDPYGYSWTIATRKEDLSPEEMDRRSKEFFKQFAPQSAQSAQPAHA